MEVIYESVKEFAKNRRINRIIYTTMTYKEKRLLKEKIYGIIDLRKELKDMMWEYLNEPIDTEEFLNISIILAGYKND